MLGIVYPGRSFQYKGVSQRPQRFGHDAPEGKKTLQATIQELRLTDTQKKVLQTFRLLEIGFEAYTPLKLEQVSGRAGLSGKWTKEVIDTLVQAGYLECRPYPKPGIKFEFRFGPTLTEAPPARPAAPIDPAQVLQDCQNPEYGLSHLEQSVMKTLLTDSRFALSLETPKRVSHGRLLNLMPCQTNEANLTIALENLVSKGFLARKRITGGRQGYDYTASLRYRA